MSNVVTKPHVADFGSKGDEISAGSLVKLHTVILTHVERKAALTLRSSMGCLVRVLTSFYQCESAHAGNRGTVANNSGVGQVSIAKSRITDATAHKLLKYHRSTECS